MVVGFGTPGSVRIVSMILPRGRVEKGELTQAPTAAAAYAPYRALWGIDVSTYDM